MAILIQQRDDVKHNVNISFRAMTGSDEKHEAKQQKAFEGYPSTLERFAGTPGSATNGYPFNEKCPLNGSHFGYDQAFAGL